MENPGDIFIYTRAVEIGVVVKGDDPQRCMTDRRYTLHVDQYGLAEIDRYPGKLSHDNRSTHPNHAADRAAWQEAVDELTESEILRWMNIGPEDAELFVTEEFQATIQPSLSALADDRRKWHVASPYTRYEGEHDDCPVDVPHVHPGVSGAV